MDYIAFSKRFFAATGIPVNLLKMGRPIYSSLGELLSFMPDVTWPVYPLAHNPEFSSLSPDLEYGHVQIEGTDYGMYIGPVFTMPVGEQIIQEFLAEQQVPLAYHEQLAELLSSIPICSHQQCLRYLIFLHLCLNQKEIQTEDFYAEADRVQYDRTCQQIKTFVRTNEEDDRHHSYVSEMSLYHFIESGDVSRLKAFLEVTREFPWEANMAKTPLRKAKNTLISLASKAAFLGAIPGGVDPERANLLVDLYVLECEQMQSLEDIHRLQYIMLMDFCQRAGNAKIPKGVSSEIHRCLTYIRNHTNQPLGVEDVAKHINRSKSYLMKRFKAEVGMQVNAYITKCKLEEARDLLAFGQMSLADISAYLGYSSQSYFQNVYKKHFGITPLQDRKRKTIL